MSEEEKKILANLRAVKESAETYLSNNNFKQENGEPDYKVKDVIRYRTQVTLTKRNTENKEQKSFYLYVVKLEDANPEIEKDDPLTELEFLVEENKDGEIVKINTIADLIQEYEQESFKESINKVRGETEKNEKEPSEHQNKEPEVKKDSLEELEEKEREEESKKKEGKENKGVKEESKRKPQRVLETVNPDQAKMDYWHTLKQAFGLPSQVAELAFAYPISSEDKVDYANITIYMLDKDGYIINDLKVDDYFEFDSSTGNNPINDDTVRHEKDENKGKTQLEENNTMVRLKAKHPNAQDNTYISIEQIDGIGDYRDINVGRQTLHTTDYVEKQVVTHRVRRDYDSEAEKLMKANAGQYKLKDIYKEAEKHKEDNEEYVGIKDGDGDVNTFECVGAMDWKELATKWGYYKDGKPDEEKAKEIYTEYKYKNPHLSDEDIVQEISDDLYEQLPGRNNNR